MVFWKRSENFNEKVKTEVSSEDYLKFRELLDIMKLKNITVELDNPIYIKGNPGIVGPQLSQVF
jgi:hypothetical protein